MISIDEKEYTRTIKIRIGTDHEEKIGIIREWVHHQRKYVKYGGIYYDIAVLELGIGLLTIYIYNYWLLIAHPHECLQFSRLCTTQASNIVNVNLNPPLYFHIFQMKYRNLH